MILTLCGFCSNTPVGAAVIYLEEAAASLAIIVPLQRGLVGNFGEHELEKLFYHLVANACERQQHSIVAESLDLLGELVLPSGTERKMKRFPAPVEACSSDLARLVSGALLNGIRSAVTRCAIPDVCELAESSIVWLRTMVDFKDPRSADYVGRVCKMMSSCAHGANGEKALSLSFQAIRFRWVLTTTPSPDIFAEVLSDQKHVVEIECMTWKSLVFPLSSFLLQAHAVGLKSQKVEADDEDDKLLVLVRFYEQVLNLTNDVVRVEVGDSSWSFLVRLLVCNFVHSTLTPDTISYVDTDREWFSPICQVGGALQYTIPPSWLVGAVEYHDFNGLEEVINSRQRSRVPSSW
jgi:hypothetical protein